MSVAEILKGHGKWIRGSEFVDLVANKLQLSERQAYRRIKHAVRNGHIIREELLDRTVLYGLPEFGPVDREDSISVEGELIPVYAEAPYGFRTYRGICKRLFSLAQEGDNRAIREYLEGLCIQCKKTPRRRPFSIPFCQKHKTLTCNLYTLAEDELSHYFKESDMSLTVAIAFYLAYEYKSHLLVISYRKLKEKLSPPSAFWNGEEWIRLWLATYERLMKLPFLDASLEPKIPDWLVGILPAAELKDGEKAIRITINAVKWHILSEGESSPLLQEKSSKAIREFENVAMRILNKAARTPLRKKINRFTEKYRRAFFKQLENRSHISIL